MLDFAKALKAHAELRCTDATGGFDKEKYARMTYWVCAYANNSLCTARGNGTCSSVLELSTARLQLELYWS